LIYLDTSVVAPFYWTEALSDQVEALLRQEVERIHYDMARNWIRRFDTPLRTEGG
jgi:predicted nucleic acid-binding protein